jgi:hypothetical protein
MKLLLGDFPDQRPTLNPHGKAHIREEEKQDVALRDR